MPNCFTCDTEISFHNEIRSKTGKPIPLNAAGTKTHGHDENGNPIEGPLPTQGLNQQQTKQFNQYNKAPQQQQQKSVSQLTSKTPSQGGSYMDTKRLRVMIEEMSKKQLEHDEILNSMYQLCRNNGTMLGELMQHFKLVEPTTASALYQAQKKQQTGEVHGWNSVPNNSTENNEEEVDDDDEEEIADDDETLEKEGTI